MLILAHMFAVSLGILIVTALGISGTVYLLSQAHTEDGASGPSDPAGIFPEDPLRDPGCLRPGAFSGQRDRHDLRNDRILPAGICAGKCFLAGRERRSDDTDPGCLKQVFQNKEMWIVIAAFIICCFVVYTLRRQAMDHA